MAERNQVLYNYRNFVGQVWENPSLIESLKADPVATLNEHGFAIPEGSTVNLIFRELNVEGNPETQADNFEEGDKTGVYNVIIPTKPEGFDPADMPLDEEILELMAGGIDQVAAIPPCCCCCPCCSDS